MWNFLLCGFAYFLYAKIQFRGKIFYPSVIFSIMWGACCIYTSAILAGFGENLYLKKFYTYQYLDEYIVYFTIASLLGFGLAHKFLWRGVNFCFSLAFIDRMLTKYKFIMWLCFGGGILRIVLMVGLVGFDIENVIDYRVAANAVMMGNGEDGFISFVFKITAYIQMLANFYIALYGLRLGFGELNLRKTFVLFLLYAPTQLATGGRLFVFYFIIFYFGSFLLGRGLALEPSDKSWLMRNEKKILVTVLAILMSIVAIMGMTRHGLKHTDKDESFIEKFAYITEGALCAEKCMCKYTPGTFQLDYGETTFINSYTPKYLAFRKELNYTRMSATVSCILTPLYLDFGFWGSVLVWFVLAFSIEALALKCLCRFTLVNFLVFLVLLKLSYETVITNSILANLPTYELLLIFAILYKPIFGKLE